MRQLSLLTAAVLTITSTAFGTVWTETFDNGVGRFDQTTGPGDSRYLWQAPGHIHATFIRDDANDRRYTRLGATLSGTTQTFGFSFVVTPLETNVGGHAGGCIGFWNSSNDNSANRLGVQLGGGVEGSSKWIKFRGAYADGGDSIGETSSYITFSYGTTYFIDVLIAGPAHLASARVYQGTTASDPFLGTIQETLSPGRAIVFDSVGMGATFPGSSQWITATIDNISYVPEPSTALLLVAAALGLRRRHRAT